MSYHFIGKSLVVLLVALCCSIWGLEAQRSEQGVIIQIVDNVDRMPVIGAQLRLGRSNYFSDADGKIRISTRPKPQTKITVTSIGYHSQTIAVGSLQFKQGHCTLSLTPTQETLGMLTVSAERREASVNAVSTKVSSADISHSLGKSLASLLEGVSGVSSIQTGANTAKPVIHGMHGNRILIVNNGVRQAGQQWDEGHAPEVDMSGSDAIHVIKGAESVRYGSEAMGGTIVLEQKKLPYNAYAHPFSIKSNNLYATNGKQFSHALSVEGMTPKLPNLAWRAHVSYSNSGDKHSARYMLNNTGSREFNFSVALGYDLLSSKVLGGLRIEPFYSRYSEYSAAPTYAQLGNVFLLKERLRLGRPPQEIILPFTRHIGYPKEGVVHHLASNKTTWTTAHWGTLLHQISYQLDRRQEFRIRRNNNSHIPEIDLSLMSLQNKLRWDKTYGAFQTEAGAQHLYTENHSIPGNGVVPPIPNYAEMSWGIYAIEKYNGKKWNAEAGVRIDDQRSKAAGYDAFTEAYGGEQHFFSVSDVKPFGTDGVAEDGDNVTKNIIEYFYKDTEPFDKSHKENAKFIHAKNPRGLKGYFQFPRGFKSFTLNIELRKFASKEEKANQVRAYDDNSAGQLVHKISVPVIIYAAAPNDALDHDDVFIADSPEDAIKFLEGTSEDALGNNEQGYPYKNILKNIMDAFGVDKRAVAIDGYYKGNGKAGDENGGLYF